MTAQQYPLPLPHQTAMTEDDFMPAPCNHEARQWVETWPDWPQHCLIITGPKGSGKTHLIHVWAARSKANLITPDAMMGYEARSLIPPSGTLAIDDAEKISGNAAQEEILFHLFNIMRETNGFLVLTGTKAPAQWGIALPDLRSRLSATPTVTILPPDDTLLMVMLVKQFHDRQITISADVINYILPRMERSTASIGALVSALDRASLAEKRGITVAFARRVLEEQYSLSPDNPLE